MSQKKWHDKVMKLLRHSTGAGNKNATSISDTVYKLGGPESLMQQL